ncbi:phenylalanine--tRNA ligase subunit beta [candidate division WOR-3 bacterium]|nr:phenylalanine--tRNA ligase subunit beta [candidate division WOR-3 bacterium]
MKLNYNWLCEWVEIDMSPEDLASLLCNLGIEVEEVELISSDAIFNLDINPNRPDLLCIQGIAREVAVRTKKELKKTIDFSITEEKESYSQPELRITIESKDDCPRYVASVIGNLKVGPSPLFISERLEKCGIRSINNVVDITNYVLLEIGQPLHAFDYEKVGNEIIIRRAKNGETISTLEEEEKRLSDLDLIIANKSKPIAIAGIMGGELSGINESTNTIVLESAFFKPPLIRKTSRRLNLSTESSYRFERTADIGIQKTASLYAVHLLKKYASGKMINSIIDTNPNPPLSRKVPFSWKRASALIGTPINHKVVLEIFHRLGFQEKGNNDDLTIVTPSFRRDIQIEEDLVEEIARFIGYNNITTRFEYQTGTSVYFEGKEILQIKRLMASLGFYEALNIPFIESSWAKNHRDNPIELKNPMWSDKNLLRTTLLPGLISNIERNLNRGINQVSVFEIGRVFNKAKDEEEMIAATMAGNIPQIWYEEERSIDFYDMKGIVETLLKELHISDFDFSNCRDPFYKKERALALIINNQSAGCFGLLAFNPCKEDIYGFEFKLEQLFLASDKSIQLKKMYRFPPVKRDLSIVLNKETPYERIKDLIKSINNLDIQVNLIDVYKDSSIGKDKKSLTIRLELYHPEKTLTEEEIEKDIENIINRLSKVGAHLRK